MEDASETKQSLKTGAFSISPQTGSDRVKQQQKNPNKHNNTPLKHLPDSKIPKKKKKTRKKQDTTIWMRKLDTYFTEEGCSTYLINFIR